MINVGVVLLIAIFIVISIAGTTGILLVVLSDQKNTIVQEPLCADAMLSTLQDISDQPCVIGPLGVTNKRYTSGYTQEAILAPYPVSYKLACSTICNSIDGNGNCIGSEQQVKQFGICISELQPTTGCVGISNPIARVATTPYYLEIYYGTVGNTDPPPLPPPSTKQCIL